MKKVYFISSRSCSEEDKYNKYLLHHSNMTEAGAISLNNDSTDFYLNRVKEAAMKMEQLDELYSQDQAVYGLFYSIQNSLVTDDEIRTSIESNKRFLIDHGIITTQKEHDFRIVYTLQTIGVDWILYGVHEIPKTNDNQTDIDNIRPIWCDKLIQYILDHVEGVTEIHLILHDNDIPGYNDHSAQMIEGKKECREKGLISEDTYNYLNGKNVNDLDISFFKHTNPCIMGVIGFQEEDIATRVKTLGEKFDEALNFLRGIDKEKKLADKKRQERIMDNL